MGSSNAKPAAAVASGTIAVAFQSAMLPVGSWALAAAYSALPGMASAQAWGSSTR